MKALSIGLTRVMQQYHGVMQEDKAINVSCSKNASPGNIKWIHTYVI